MDGGALLEFAQRFLDQDQDLAFGFTGAAGSFVVVGFEAREAVNAPFEVRIQLASQDPDIDLHALMDSQACLGIFEKYQAPRHLNGIVTEVSRGDSGIRRTFYSVTLRPEIHRLAHTSDSRIWQHKTVPDIVKEVLEDHKIANVEWRLAEPHGSREYCTQYRETALAFIERLLAEEGIFYFFEHTQEMHMLVLTDAPLATPELEHAPLIQYNTRSGGQLKGSSVSSFTQHERLRSSDYEMNEYTFHNPAAQMNEKWGQQENNGLADTYQIYDYPGRYKDPKDVGTPFVKHRMESVRVDATTGQGVTNNIHLCPAFHFTLADHDDIKANGSHFLLSVTHTGQQPTALEEDADTNTPTTYSADFTTMPARLPYRPPLARKPLVDGPQIAVVTGPEGEEIYCDEHGRVKVFFYWDRYGKKNEHSSCWIRVSQNWAGGSWGHMAIPRIGHSVIVDYLEGDPDQPIITGRTYHANNKVPYPLPENKTKMVIRSDSHKGTGFNEFSFEDEAGKEIIALHAQKDQTLKVLNNRMKRVDNDQVESVGTNKSIEVGNNHQEKIGGSMNLSVGGGPLGLFGMLGAITAAGGQDALAGSEAVGNPMVSKFVGTLASAGAAAEATTLLGKAGFNSAGNNRQAAGANQSSAGSALGRVLSSVMPMSGVKTTMVEKFVSDTIGLARTEQIGAFKNTSVGHTMTVHVGKEFIINCGKSKFIMDSDGNVTIIGTKFNFAASEHVQVSSKVIDLN